MMTRLMWQRAKMTYREDCCDGCYYHEEDGGCTCPKDCNYGSGRIIGMIPGTLPETNIVGRGGWVLKPCPVCGAPAKLWEWSNGAQIDCSKWMGDRQTIGMHFVCIFAQTTDEAVKRWNEEKR